MFRSIRKIFTGSNNTKESAAVTLQAKPKTESKTVAKQEKKNGAETKKTPVGSGVSPIPSGPLRIVAENLLDDKDVLSLALFSRGFYHETLDVLMDRKLAHHITFAPTKENKAELLAMLYANPELLNNKILLAKDRSKRVFKNKTLYQLAYGSGNDDYCHALKSVFIKLHKGDEEKAVEEMKKQRQDMLVDDKDEKNTEAVSKAHLEEILKPVRAAIGAEEFKNGKKDDRLILSDATLLAINEFRIEYKKIQANEGMHFRYSTFLEALDTYIQAAQGWGNDYKKCRLFEDAILSIIEADFPVNDAQKASQGLYYQQGNKLEPCNRSLALREGGKNFYEVVNGDSSDFVLTGCYVDTSFGGQGGVSHTPSPLRWRRLRFSNLMSDKNINLALLAPCTQAKPEVPACSPLR